MSRWPSFTKTFHKTTYSTIDPNRSELSAKGKVIIITGGAHGSLGAAVAHSFAKAGASKIAILGRTEKTLQLTKEDIESAHPNTSVMVVPTDVSKSESVGIAAFRVREALGAFDVFVHCAAWMPEVTLMTGADEDDWWQAFEVNAKPIYLFARHFLPKAKANATYIGVNAGGCHLPAAVMPKDSAYSASKLASAKLDSYLAAESPNIRVFTVHPGVLRTPMLDKQFKNHAHGAPPEIIDDISLPADFTVWISSSESDFLRSRFVWANWDVSEMIARKEEIESNPALLTIGLQGL